MGADMGYPSLFRNFASEHMPSIFDYGPGAGTGGLWMQDPGMPAEMNNQFYSGELDDELDLPPSDGAEGPRRSSRAGQTVLSITRPTDMAMDGSLHMYVSSLSGGQFRYIGDSVGYVVRISNTTKPADVPPKISGASAADLIAALSSASNDVRLAAQRELLRKGPSAATSAGIERVMFDDKRSAETRVAALWTLEQLDGVRSHATLWRAEKVPALRESAIRALTDRRDQLTDLNAAPFVAALKDANPDVRVQAINSLVRLSATSSASALIPLLADADPAISHLTRQALVTLDAREVALRALDTGSPAVQTGALQALERMHDVQTVEALITRAQNAKSFAARRPILAALARLYNVEATWTGDWWTTHPSTVGPYYAPQGWEESPRIRPVLVQALSETKGADFTALAGDLALNGVLPTGSGPLLAALNAGNNPQRDTVIVSLIGHQQLDDSFLPVLEQLEKQPGAIHGAVATLVSAQTSLPDDALPMLRREALDPSLSGAARAEALTAIARLTSPAALAAATEVFARVNPAPGTDPAVETAWRRYVGDRNRIGQIDQFVELAGNSDPEQRVLAFSVLTQLQRLTKGRNNMFATMFAGPLVKVNAAVDNAWKDPAIAPNLVRAIAIMKLEANYADQLKAATRRRSRNGLRHPSSRELNMSQQFDSNGVSRRDFVKGVAGMAGAFAMSGCMGTAAAVATSGGAMSSSSLSSWRDRMGLELFTVRDVIVKDFEGTLAQVRAAGYREVETTTYAGKAPSEVRAILDRVGLTAPSTHVALMQGPDLEKQLAGYQMIGHRYAAASGPRPAGMGPGGRAGGPPPGGAPGGPPPGGPPRGGFVMPAMTMDAVKRQADMLNAVGAAAKPYGIKVLIHNHTMEFEPFADGTTPYEMLFASTDPSSVVFELDIGWARVAGQDPLALFAKHPGRFPLWHVKDMAGLAALSGMKSESERMRAAKIVPVGSGDIDYRPIFEHAAETGLEHYFIEQDTAPDTGSLDAMRLSATNLRRQLGG